MRSRKVDEPLGRFGRDGLSALVMSHVALRASHAGGQGRLGHAEALSDGFDDAHEDLHSSGTTCKRQQRHCLAVYNSAGTVRRMTTGERRAKVTPENREEARRLRNLWEKALERPSQQVFGEKFGIGNQSAVGQFLRGDTPLSLNAAMGFARGLSCDLADFSPRLAAIAAKSAAFAPPESTEWPFTKELLVALKTADEDTRREAENLVRVRLRMQTLASSPSGAPDYLDREAGDLRITRRGVKKKALK